MWRTPTTAPGEHSVTLRRVMWTVMFFFKRPLLLKNKNEIPTLHCRLHLWKMSQKIHWDKCFSNCLFCSRYTPTWCKIWSPHPFYFLHNNSCFNVIKIFNNKCIKIWNEFISFISEQEMTRKLKWENVFYFYHLYLLYLSFFFSIYNCNHLSHLILDLDYLCLFVCVGDIKFCQI